MLDCITFQCDIDAIVAWCVAWQLTNVSKRLFIRYGLVNRSLLNYFMSSTLLKQVATNNDPGVMFNTKLSFSMHCNYVANKGYLNSNMLLQRFHTRDHDVQMRLYNAFVRSILEYSSPVWSLRLTKDINVIEQVQKVFTKNLR